MPPEDLARFTHFVRFASVNPDENRGRSYMLSWGTSLFGEPSLIRPYTRLGTPGRVRADLYADRESVQKDILRLIKPRLRHGYELDEIDAQPTLFP